MAYWWRTILEQSQVLLARRYPPLPPQPSQPSSTPQPLLLCRVLVPPSRSVERYPSTLSMSTYKDGIPGPCVLLSAIVAASTVLVPSPRPRPRDRSPDVLPHASELRPAPLDARHRATLFSWVTCPLPAARLGQKGSTQARKRAWRAYRALGQAARSSLSDLHRRPTRRTAWKEDVVTSSSPPPPPPRVLLVSQPARASSARKEKMGKRSLCALRAAPCCHPHLGLCTCSIAKPDTRRPGCSSMLDGEHALQSRCCELITITLASQSSCMP
ncbi:hypothetical protein DFH27DRAFT_124365 [Peziza echinospora]|nr:hypothetical protein DFH27DRAFT_124365 [Peziza echinospora]